MNLLDTNFLFASLIWGSVGVGYCVYGKRQQAWVPFAGGILMITASYFIGSALLMSLVCIGLMVAVSALIKRGF